MYQSQILKKLRKYIKEQPLVIQEQRDNNVSERYTKISSEKVAFIVVFTRNQQL